MIITVPKVEAKGWPTLGPQICDFIEEHLVHGPGDLRGEPARLDEEKRGLIYRMYEVYPKRSRQKGRRRFKRVAISLRKGSAKTEFAAWLAIVEAHPAGPVRTVGFDTHGQPIGGPVTDPYIPLVAYTEEQSEELAYGALRVILENCELGNDFDIGLARVMRPGGDGKVIPLSTAPGPRDGARTTFQVFDETHRFTLPRLKLAYRTMLANIPKRRLADAWSFEITTAYAPGERSVAEETMDYALSILKEKSKDPQLFFFHRQAGDDHDLKTAKGLREAVIEASGPVAEWSDITNIVAQWKDPNEDRAYLERLWLNRLVRTSEQAFDSEAFKTCIKPKQEIPPGSTVTLGFDGARYRDSTGLVATDVKSGHQELVGAWEKPPAWDKWEVPEIEVEAAVAEAFEKWDVWRMYADPPMWDTNVAAWSGKYGEKVVIAWPTNRYRKMSVAVRAYANAIIAKEISHDGSEPLIRHVGNAHRREMTTLDEEGRRMWIIQKATPDSPHKIDVAVAAVLSWQARLDALEKGIGFDGPSVYDERFAKGQEVIEAW